VKLWETDPPWFAASGFKMEMTNLVLYEFFRMFEYALTAETAYPVTHGPYLSNTV